jgi:hypothetical protein
VQNYELFRAFISFGKKITFSPFFDGTGPKSPFHGDLKGNQGCPKHSLYLSSNRGFLRLRGGFPSLAHGIKTFTEK